MKYNCKWCNAEIDISQSEKAKSGLKKVTDHEIECFKKKNPNFGKIMSEVQKSNFIKPVPRKFDMQEIIGYLHQEMGRIPSESDVLRFNMLLETNPTVYECREFVKLLRGDR